MATNDTFDSVRIRSAFEKSLSSRENAALGGGMQLAGEQGAVGTPQVERRLRAGTSVTRVHDAPADGCALLGGERCQRGALTQCTVRTAIENGRKRSA